MLTVNRCQTVSISKRTNVTDEDQLTNYKTNGFGVDVALQLLDVLLKLKV